MTTTRTVLRDKDTAGGGDLYMSFELGDKRWQMSIGDRRRCVSRYTVAAGDTAAVADCIIKAGARLRTGAQARVHSCYEAGRDGWWLHRWLSELGVDNIVVDAASIEVNRRARRAKTDRLDADKLLAMLVRYHAGEHVWAVAREPSREDEDARRVHRELQRPLSRCCGAHVAHRRQGAFEHGGRSGAGSPHGDRRAVRRGGTARQCERFQGAAQRKDGRASRSLARAQGALGGAATGG